MLYVEPSLALSLTELAIEKRKSFAPLARRIKHWLKRGRLKIVIFGPGGTGKTTLGHFLAGNLDIGNTSAGYAESMDVESFKLKGDLVCSLIVPPGQELREYHWTGLYRDLAAGKSSGVINVVSWGYHSFQALSYQDTKYFKPPMTKAEFFESYLQNRRDREQEIINNLTPRLMDAKGKIWMITLVTKQDLWWDDRTQVDKHYLEGPYNDCIQQIIRKRGEQNFAHEYLSVSLIINNLVTSAGEVLASTVSGYGQPIQLANSTKFVETVNSFASR